MNTLGNWLKSPCVQPSFNLHVQIEGEASLRTNGFTMYLVIDMEVKDGAN